MSNGIIIESSTGKILRLINAPSIMIALQARTGETAAEITADPTTEYITNVGTSNDITARPAMGTSIDFTTLTADGTDSINITSIINPTDVSFVVPEGVVAIDPVTVTTGSLTFKTEQSGIYTITLKSFPNLDTTYTVTTT